MAQLSQADFYAKWVPLLADNVFQDIDGPRLAQLLADIRDSFAPARLGQAPNVPAYDQFAVYAVGYLVRYTLAGQPEGFYYARQAGVLPAPTGEEDDLSWRAIPRPVAATALSQALSLPEARGLAAGAESADGSVQAGRLYAIDLGLGRTYYVEGLAGRFDVEGTLVEADGTRTRGSLDLATGTFTARAADGGGSTLSVQVTASSFAGFADMLLTNPAARLDTLDPFFNAAGVQAQLLTLGGQAYRPYRDTTGVVATLNADLAAYWAEWGSNGRPLLRLRVVPASPAIVAHAQVWFTQAPSDMPQAVHPHNSGFRLYGNQFALTAYDWNHLTNATASGGTLTATGNYSSASATGSPSFGNSGTGLRAMFTARHNQAYSYDYLGYTASATPSANGSNFAAAFYITQGNQVAATRGSTTLAMTAYNGELLTLELWDDGIRWYVGSTLLHYDPVPPADAALWLGANFYAAQAAWLDVQAGGQTANPR